MKYITSWSGGKDSTATIILVHEHDEPLDEIIYVEVMYDKDISGEHPEHIDFIKNKAIPIFEKWGYKTTILHSNKTFLDLFFHKPIRGKYKNTNLREGFPMIGKCYVNQTCKVNILKNYQHSLGNTIDYVGIAIDEPMSRLERLSNNQISLLLKYKYTEQMAKELCEKYDLLSPIYTFSTRNGCWFCPCASDRELQHLRKYHHTLWDKFLSLEDESNLIRPIWCTLKNKSLHGKDRDFDFLDRQISIDDYLKTIEGSMK